jgi:DinB superfamily
MDAVEREALIDRYRGGIDEVDAVLAALRDEDLDRRPAEPDGWTPRQVIHHLADSESMAYIRLRRLLAEDDPVIVGYDEPKWARRLHYERPIDSSLAVLRAVRTASLELLESIEEAEWSRTGTHSESGPYGVEGWLEIYASHPRDHASQIRAIVGSSERGEPR